MCISSRTGALLVRRGLSILGVVTIGIVTIGVEITGGVFTRGGMAFADTSTPSSMMGPGSLITVSPAISGNPTTVGVSLSGVELLGGDVGMSGISSVWLAMLTS